jgi:hypothetical protein
MIPTSVLVLAAVVILPLASLLVDLALLEAARCRGRITAPRSDTRIRAHAHSATDPTSR